MVEGGPVDTILVIVVTTCLALIVLNWAGLIDALIRKRNYAFAPRSVAGVLGSLAL